MVQIGSLSGAHRPVPAPWYLEIRSLPWWCVGDVMGNSSLQARRLKARAVSAQGQTQGWFGGAAI